MALDRWVALVFLLIFAVYGYTAYFTMDGSLAPFMRRNPIWPSTFPKALSVLGLIASLMVLLAVENNTADSQSTDIDYRKLRHYKFGQALVLIGLMAGYAIALRPLGFLLSTVLFLTIGSIVLGERRWLAIAITSIVAAAAVWYLVQVVLGIYLRPLPFLLG